MRVATAAQHQIGLHPGLYTLAFKLRVYLTTAWALLLLLGARGDLNSLHPPVDTNAGGDLLTAVPGPRQANAAPTLEPVAAY